MKPRAPGNVVNRYETRYCGVEFDLDTFFLLLDDGTVSDGKVDTYTRCVEAICGSADTFFTSVFSAQGKRQLSAYRNGEIKTLLADLLGQEAIRAQGLRAAETARLLKASLGAMRQELAGVDEEALRIANERGRLQGAEDRVVRCLSERQSAQATLEVARQQQAQLLAERDQSRSTEARRSQLQGECVAASQSSIQAIEALKAQDRGEQQRLDRLQQRVAHRTSQERSRWSALQDRRCKCLDALKQAQPVVLMSTVSMVHLSQRVPASGVAAVVTQLDVGPGKGGVDDCAVE